LISARDFAIQLHGGQLYGLDEPYSVHLDAVHSILVEAGFTGPILDAAYLHDVLEDTDCTLDELVNHFEGEVANLVWSVTGTGRNRAERNSSIASRLTIYTKGKDLKVADRIANLEAAIAKGNIEKLKMYTNEHPAFLKVVEHDSTSHALLKRLNKAFFDGLHVLAES
jgi:(p)ppGpp synthase/HD superfamily hydrolase